MEAGNIIGCANPLASIQPYECHAEECCQVEKLFPHIQCFLLALLAAGQVDASVDEPRLQVG